VEKIRDLINHPDVNLLDTRVGGTSAEIVTKRIELELFATTRREWFLNISVITGIWVPMDVSKKKSVRD
jgi:hypothetical protein